ncbi:MAG: twin-arginine translocation signal domain-containing protein [Faecalibacterium prausnitzii]|nr:twin-arginine translocation signal domain-containing protein [Faecalibacterium prausnitzii]
MKMTRRDFLNVSTAAAVVCATALLPVEKAAAAQLWSGRFTHHALLAE